MPEDNGILDTIRRTAYAQALADFNGDEAKASHRAWEAVRNAGYYQDKEGFWTKKNETDTSWYKWNNYWRRIKYANIFNVGAMESLGRVPPAQGMKFFRARILAAVPGKSLNGRIYSRETLQQATPLYEGKPFILDHVIDDVEKVAGIIGSPRYGVEEGWDGQKREGLWLDTVGMCSEGILDRLTGKGPVPPLIRGVSIGGQGDGQYNTDGGIVIKNFQPAELSVTAFPGIPEAQIADIRMVSESVKNVQLPSAYPKWEEVQRYRMNIPLEQAQKNVNRSLEKAGVRMPIREIGSGPGQTNTPVVSSSPRPGIRGLNAQMDADARIPDGGAQFIVPNQTYGSNKGIKVDPYNTPSGSTPFQSIGADPYGNLKGQSSTEGSATGAGYGAKSSRDSTGWSIKTPSLGKTTTKTPGFGKLGPSGSGISDEEEERARVQATVASLINDLKGVQYEMMTGKKLEAKIDISKPPEEEEEEEEEESKKERRILMRRLARLEQNRVTRELSYDLGDQRKPGGGPMPDAAVTDYQRTRMSLPNPGAVQGTLGQNFWNPPNEASGADSTGFDKSAMHVTSGRIAGAGGFVSDPNEFVAANPVRSGGEEEEEEEEERQLLWKRLIQLGLEQEATGQTMPKTSTSITNPIPKLGNTTTKTPGFGKLSPSGTGLTDQDEEERYILYRLDRIHKQREASPTADKQEEEEEEEKYLLKRLVTLRQEKVVQPVGEEEGMNRSPGSLINQEEEDAMNPLAKAAGVDISQEEETRVPDVSPVEGSATAFPVGNISLWQRFAKPNPWASLDKMRESLAKWDELKQPKPQPVQKMHIRMEESARPIQQKASTAIATLPGVPAKGMMTTSPTFRDTMGYQSQDTRAMRERLTQIMEDVKKTPFGNYNLGGNIWKAVLPEVIVRE